MVHFDPAPLRSLRPPLSPNETPDALEKQTEYFNRSLAHAHARLLAAPWGFSTVAATHLEQSRMANQQSHSALMVFKSVDSPRGPAAKPQDAVSSDLQTMPPRYPGVRY